MPNRIINDDEFYEQMLLTLVDMAVEQFDVGPDDAEALAFEVLLANLRYMDADNLHARLSGAMTAAIRRTR